MKMGNIGHILCDNHNSINIQYFCYERWTQWYFSPITNKLIWFRNDVLDLSGGRGWSVVSRCQTYINSVHLHLAWSWTVVRNILLSWSCLVAACMRGWPSFTTQRCVFYHDCGCAIQAKLDLAVAGVGHAFGLGVTLGTIVLGSWRYCSIESS